MTFGDYIRESRIRSGLTQKDVSDHFGWQSCQYQSNIERNVSLPPLAICKELSKFLKIPKHEMTKRLVSVYRNKVSRALK